MPEILKILILPAIIAVGWYTSALRSGVSRTLVFVATLSSVLLFLIMIVTGLMRGHENLEGLHRIGSHFFIILMWLTIPFSVGTILQRSIRSRPIAGILQTLALFLLYGAVILESFTGYLGPSYITQTTEETRNRFEVLHIVILPILFGILFAVSFWALHRILFPHEDISSD